MWAGLGGLGMGCERLVSRICVYVDWRDCDYVILLYPISGEGVGPY